MMTEAPQSAAVVTLRRSTCRSHRLVSLYFLALLANDILIVSASTIQIKSVEDISQSTRRLHQRVRRTGSRRRYLLKTQVGATVNQATAFLQGPGVTIISAQLLNGDPNQLGVFTNGSDSIGIDSGIILSTGSVANANGPNTGDTKTTDYGGPGYGPLDNLVTSGDPTKDAAVLQIQFVCDNGQADKVHLQYAFASEEYNEYVNEQYNDVFGIFLNGLTPTDNVASLPDGTAVAINSVNCGNPYDPASTNPNCKYFVNNELSSRTTAYNIEYDGFTVPLQVDANIVAGTNTITVAVGDVGDGQFDSAVFLGEASLTCDAPASSTPPAATPATTTAVPISTPPVTSPPTTPSAITTAPATSPPVTTPPVTTPPTTLPAIPLPTQAATTSLPTVPRTSKSLKSKKSLSSSKGYYSGSGSKGYYSGSGSKGYYSGSGSEGNYSGSGSEGNYSGSGYYDEDYYYYYYCEDE